MHMPEDGFFVTEPGRTSAASDGISRCDKWMRER